MLEIELAIAVPLDGYDRVFKRDPLDLESLVEQGEEIEPNPGRPCGGDLGSPVTNVQVLQGDEQTREEADSQTAADFDFHPQIFRDGRFNPGFVGVDIQKKKHGDRDEDKKSDERAEDNGDRST
ncbi:MAG: hypothetical protein WBP86_10470 [Thiobacillaceae bacterium]